MKKFFVPCSENNFKPLFLKTRASIALAFAILLIFLLFINIPNLIRNIASNSQLAAILPSVLIELTNEERENVFVSTLQENELLNQAALLKATDMATKGYFAHVSPDGKSPWHWIQEAGYRYQYAGENLAVNFSKSRDVNLAWMNSPTHRANIVMPVYRDIGIGVATGTFNGNESIFVAQVFASPFSVNYSANVYESIGSFTTVSGENFFRYLLYHNHDLINIILIVFLLLIITALILKIFINIKIQHPKLINNALFLIAFIIILLLMNKYITEQKQGEIQFSTYEYSIDQNGQINR